MKNKDYHNAKNKTVDDKTSFAVGLFVVLS